jgi:ATP-dependent Clp protease ATP-binding subunit ClpB
VLLFDEVEKAHPEVFNLLLQLLDDGRLTDGHGRTIDFRNTVVIMTSNIGGAHIQEMLEERMRRPAAYWVKGNEELKERIMEDLKTFFRPEFLNRVDEVIIFNPLTQELLKQIVDIQVQRMKKYIREKNIDVRLTDKTKEYFTEIGFDPVYGARPLKRALQREILNPLSLRLLDKTFKEGDIVEVDFESDKLILRKGMVEEVKV